MMEVAKVYDGNIKQDVTIPNSIILERTTTEMALFQDFGIFGLSASGLNSIFRLMFFSSLERTRVGKCKAWKSGPK